MAADVHRILAADYLADLDGLDIADVRHRRAECQEIETGLSLLRRLVQGRLDIVEAERARRRGGEGPAADADLTDLIDRLPQVLADRQRPQGVGRLPQLLAPAELPEDLAVELDELLPPSRLATVAVVADDELAELSGQLAQLERSVSQRRRELFERIDALQGELTRRYRTGEASPDTLLS